MPIRVAILWHMHQPFYKDLVTGEYRLPWVRLHALKDYYGMVRLLQEFPGVHQTFNLVPSLITQLQDYVSGAARDPFLAIAGKPAGDLDPGERRFALQYLFQANATHLIGRYPRYAQLLEQYHGAGGGAERAAEYFVAQDLTDLQVLSQLAWFDEVYLEEPEIAALVAKGRNFSGDDQRFVVERQRELIGKVLPAYREAAQRGSIEISTSPFYHPILPLLCDSDMGAVSSPGLKLPSGHFRQPQDAREQLQRGLDLHQQAFGIRPRGVWPSEGSVSEEVIAIAHALGIEWMASDEGILARSLGTSLQRDDGGILQTGSAEQLYRVYRFEKADAAMHLLFRDHVLSDLIGFVYAGMEANEAAAHLVQRILDCAQPLLERGIDPVVPIILDGENAWEYYPHSGREFLRRFYATLEADPTFEAVTFSEAISHQREFGRLKSVAPGSWINSNFNVWIGSEEDNRSWDYLYDAREFFAANSAGASAEQRALAWEELLIAEGSDWNWWYGPEHHSANDAEFDALYRKHLSNVYTALGGVPPEALAQPIVRGGERPYFVPQTAYIHPQIEAEGQRYFDWVGAAVYTAERASSAMHGRQHFLDTIHAGIDENNLYVRADLAATPGSYEVVIAVESLPPGALKAVVLTQLHITIADGTVNNWRLQQGEQRSAYQNDDEPRNTSGVAVALRPGVEAMIPLAMLRAERGGKIRLRVSLWRDRLPLDALPLEGSVELDVLSEHDFSTAGY